MINITEFMDCCGLTILYNFRSTDCDQDGDAYNYDHTTAQVLDSLDKAIKGMSPEKDGVRGYVNRGAGLVVLNDLQRPFWEPHLIERKFKVIADDIFNPNSDQRLTIYLINFGWTEDD